MKGHRQGRLRSQPTTSIARISTSATMSRGPVTGISKASTPHTARMSSSQMQPVAQPRRPELSRSTATPWPPISSACAGRREPCWTGAWTG